jgi:hypothetical protein
LLPIGVPSDRYDSAFNHSLSASVGMAPGTCPFGWTVGAGYVREDVNRLDQTFESSFIRGDVVYPVSPTIAVTAGVGYEKLEASQQDFLRDANGNAVITPGGNLVADPSRPRLLAYDQDGVIWDAGVIWRPSRRTSCRRASAAATATRPLPPRSATSSIRPLPSPAASMTASTASAASSSPT